MATRLEFHGVVSRLERQFGNVGVGDSDVVDECYEHGFKDRCIVYLNGEKVCDGPAGIELGWGYSSWTWMDGDTMRVGEFDLVTELEKHEGHEVHLIVTDTEL